MKLSVASLLAVTIFCAGCESTHRLTASAPLSANLKTAPLKANITVGEKIQGNATTYTVLGLFKFGDNEYADGVDYGVSGFASFFDAYGDAKSAAAYKATTSHNADVIIAPRYVIKEKNYFFYKRVDVLVEGYRGTIATIM